MRKSGIFWLINIFIPLIIGLLLYIWLRPDVLVARTVIQLCPRLAEVTYSGNSATVILIKNHMSDFLWAYSLMISVLWICEKYGIDRKKGIYICLLVDFVMEGSQVINPFFTFDCFDLITEFIGTIIACFVSGCFCKFAERRKIPWIKRRIKQQAKLP